MALAAVCALTACGLDSEADGGPVLEQQPHTELRARIGDSGELVVAGETLNAPLLKSFYARHGFEPVWEARPAQVHSLIQAVARAGEQGMAPELFHAAALRHDGDLAPLDRDLLLSDAFLSYADALARGAVPVERRGEDQVLTPDPVDVPARLDAAIGSRNPGASIEALAPADPGYLALREALRKYRTGSVSDRKLGASRVRTIEANLERRRWLPRRLPAERAWVNVADQRLALYRANQLIFSTRVVVGEEVKGHQTPEFHAKIDASFFNPPWVIPKDIVDAEIQPKIDADPNYLTKNNMIMLESGDAEQLPGPEAGLGALMFDMPNKFDVYLHDTPDRYIFKRDNRRLSHGCVRVQDPRDFAALLLREPLTKVNEGIAVAGTSRHDLPAPIPVFIVYETAFIDPVGSLQFRPDFYDRDSAIWEQLEHRRAPVQEGELGS